MGVPAGRCLIYRSGAGAGLFGGKPSAAFSRRWGHPLHHALRPEAFFSRGRFRMAGCKGFNQPD